MKAPRMSWAKWSFDAWDTDPGLRLCSMAAQGFWMRLLVIASKAEGYVRVGGKNPTLAEVAKIVGHGLEDVAAWDAELRERAVYSVTRNGARYSRRMVRECKISQKNSENGKLGGNPTLLKTKGISASLKADRRSPDKAETETETETETDIPPKPPLGGGRRKTLGSRIPANWEPGPAGEAYALGQGCDRKRIARLAEAFLDYWTAKAGATATKVDWAATWRTWVRNDLARSPAASKQVDWI